LRSLELEFWCELGKDPLNFLDFARPVRYLPLLSLDAWAGLARRVPTQVNICNSFQEPNAMYESDTERLHAVSPEESFLLPIGSPPPQIPELAAYFRPWNRTHLGDMGREFWSRM
jgi:hypothetical protein